MKSVVNENEGSGKKARKARSGTKTGTMTGEAPVRLPVSWEAAPPQPVAILDLTGQTDLSDFATLPSRGPAVTGNRPEVRCPRCASATGKI
jgi:hypothetical protein